MKYCTRCLYPANHPLHLTFDESGVCSGCRIHEEKDRLDWGERKERLRNILGSYRSDGGDNYDCVIPITGARDSHFIVHTVKKEFGLNPLLVSYNRHYNTERGIRNLSYLRTFLDCDHVQFVVSPDTVKKVIRETIGHIGSIHWHVLAGHSVFPVQIAVRHKIPLIVWGVHQGCDQVGMFSHLDEVEMTRKYRCEHDLMGWEGGDLVDGREGLTEEDLRPFFYPRDEEISKVGVRGIYLSNYIRWDTKRQHEDMIERYGYESAKQQRTFDTYNDVDCQHYSGLHDWIKFVKFGYGKVTDHASREIRLRRMTRAEGIELVHRYQSVRPRDKSTFLAWVGMSEDDFDACIDRFRDAAIWQGDEASGWKLLDSITDHADDKGVEQSALGKIEDCRFMVTPTRDPEANEEEYRLLAKGYVD